MALHSNRGFTIIEVMIVITLIAIITAIAIPAYSDYVTRARRADAKIALINFQIEQEKFRTNNVNYGNAGDLGLPADSPDGYYEIDVSGAVTSTSYSLIAEPKAPQVDPECGTFVFTVSGAIESRSIANGNATNPKETCWQR